MARRSEFDHAVGEAAEHQGLLNHLLADHGLDPSRPKHRPVYEHVQNARDFHLEEHEDELWVDHDRQHRLENEHG